MVSTGDTGYKSLTHTGNGTMQQFTPESIREFLDARKGCTFIALYAITEPKMNKTGNPYFGNVVHIWGRNVTFGANYANSVNRRWAEAGHDFGDGLDYFQAEALWRGKGERINSYMARHTVHGQEYLVYQLRTDKEGQVFPPLFDEYRLADTGQVIQKGDIEQWLPKKAPSKKQRVESMPCRETFPRTVKVNGGECGLYQLGVYQINIDQDCLIATDYELPSVDQLREAQQFCTDPQAKPTMLDRYAREQPGEFIAAFVDTMKAMSPWEDD